MTIHNVPSEGDYLTVVYKNIQAGDEARLLTSHPKATAFSWSHAMNERNEAQGELARRITGEKE